MNLLLVIARHFEREAVLLPLHLGPEGQASLSGFDDRQDISQEAVIVQVAVHSAEVNVDKHGEE